VTNSGDVSQPLSIDTPGRRRATGLGDVASLAIALLLYTALTLWHTWPLALHMGDRLPHDAGDPALNAWILWWNATTRPLSEAWWNGLGFWPTGGTIAFSEHLLGLAWITSPIIWMGGSPALAYNVAFLLSFALSAWATHVLVWRLTGRHDAGLIAGLAFGFAPIRAGHLSHLQVLTTYWMPLALLGLHQFWRTRGARWLALFAIAWLLQALSNNYYALFLSVLVALWLAWFGLTRGARGRFAAAAAASVIAATGLIPLALGYTATHAEHGLRRGLNEAAIFSADLAAFFNSPRLLWAWGWLQTETWAERELFGGVTAVLLLALAAFVRTTPPDTANSADHATNVEPTSMPESTPRWMKTTRRVLLVLGGVIVLLAVGLWTNGEDQIALAGLTISTRHPEKPMMVGVVLLIGAVALFPATWRPLRRRTVFGFYVTAWVVCLVLSLGPELRLFETTLLYRAPYALLFEIVPGFDGVRVPARFTVIAAFCLSVAAALAFARLVRAADPRARLIVAVVALALVIEGSLRRLPMATLPDTIPQLASASGIVLELPFGDAFTEAAALYRSSTHRHRIANGYSGYEPLFYRALRDGVVLKDRDALVELSTLTPVTVLIDRSRDRDGEWQTLATQAGAQMRSADARYVVLYLPRLTRAPQASPTLGAAVPVTTITASVRADRAATLLDGNPLTGWDTDGLQKSGDAITADLGTVSTIGAVALDQGWWPLDVPRRLEVAVSEDGETWTIAWHGTTAVQTMRAALANPRVVRLVMPFAGRRGRYVRLRQTADAATSPWKIAELRVFGPSRPVDQTPTD
jgi:hypothetical protein